MSDENLDKYFKYQMKENDERNPFGPNYHKTPYLYKKYYKIRNILKHVNISETHENFIQESYYIFYFGCLGAGAFTLLTSLFLRNHLFKNFLINFRVKYYKYDNYVNFVMFSMGTTVGYNYLFPYSIEKYYYPLEPIYLEEAIKNGFEDYNISKDKKSQGLIDFFKIILKLK